MGYKIQKIAAKVTNLVCEICEARTGGFVAYVEQLADVVALSSRYQTNTTSSRAREVVVRTFVFLAETWFLQKESRGHPKDKGFPRY